jgi:hypothetical protein
MVKPLDISVLEHHLWSIFFSQIQTRALKWVEWTVHGPHWTNHESKDQTVPAITRVTKKYQELGAIYLPKLFHRYFIRCIQQNFFYVNHQGK